MNRTSIALFACAVGFALTLQSPVARAGGGEATVYSFGSHNGDGYGPAAGLTAVKNTMFGTTTGGGSHGYGTVFSLDPKTRVEKVIYNFCALQNCADGADPVAPLIAVNGTLYGTTKLGGAYGDGTVFSVDPKTGVETVLHSFGSGTDGSGPEAGLIDVNGTLYGTTFAGGSPGGGTVFGVDAATGSETVVYAFCSQASCADGREPVSSVLNVNGVLYGTTESGGKYNGGTVFALEPTTGVESVVYSFCYLLNCADGDNPEAGLIAVKGILYGTTNGGGAGGLFGGTVFAVDPKNGSETVLHSFPSCTEEPCTDGDNPADALLEANGTLYGTTSGGGAHESYGGTVFSIDPDTGKEKVLHSFCGEQNCTDGDDPLGSLVDYKSKLYGTASSGGGHNLGAVFSLTP